MLKTEIQEEINKLQKQLKNYQTKKEQAENEQKELDDIIINIRRKSQEIEEGLQETLKNIQRKIDKINRRSKFKVTYLENAKQFLQNTDALSALECTHEAERKAKIKFLDLDDLINDYSKKIIKIEKEISALKHQLNQMGV